MRDLGFLLFSFITHFHKMVDFLVIFATKRKTFKIFAPLASITYRNDIILLFQRGVMKVDLSSPIIHEIFIKNLFSVLSADRGTRLFGRISLTHSVREFSLTKDTLQEWFVEWKETPGNLIKLDTDEENRDIIILICSALLNDENVHSDIMRFLIDYAVTHGIKTPIINTIFSKKLEFIDEKSLVKRAMKMKTAYLGNGEPHGYTLSGKKPEKDTHHFFIANQVTEEGFDELQRLLMAYYLDLHTAIDGPPGVGKTHSVIEVAKILGANLYTKTCSNRTTESHIISYPVLGVQNGVSVTTHVNGPLVNAMIDPGIFYGDEFNLLKEDVQKRMNSAFDERRSIDRSDGMQVFAKKGFWGVISYNPTQNFTSRDLEDSVADRFIHLHYERWTPDFKAYVAHKKAIGNKNLSFADFGITLSYRGISSDGRFFRGVVENNTIVWYDFFNNEKVSHAPEYRYQVYDNRQVFGHGKDSVKTLEELERNAFSEIKFARMLSMFTDLLNSLSRTGKSPLLKKIGIGDVLEDEDLDLLTLHESSARIEMAALRHYHFMLERGFNRFLAQSYATRLVIDQLCYGQYRNKMLRTNSVYQLVMMIARSMHLFGDTTKYNTNLASPQSIKR